MLFNYIKLSFRLMGRNIGASVINILGLAIGFSAFLTLWPFADNELKSDQYHNESERMARLAVDFKWTDDGGTWEGFIGAFNSWGVANEIKNTFPHVQEVSRLVAQLHYNERLQGVDRDLFITVADSTGNKLVFQETRTIFADANFFSFFAIPLLSGNAGQVLTDPNTAVISQSISRKYFGEQPAMGKIIFLKDSIPVKVTGVFQDLPRNTHFMFDIVFSVAGKTDINIVSWNRWTGYCYFKLEEGYDFAAFQNDLNARKEDLYAYVKLGCPHCDWGAIVQPLHDVVFSDLRGNAFHSKSKFLLQTLYFVSFIVLTLAWVNYVVLSLHTLNRRLKELGTRKVTGAKPADFFLQFFVDSLVINGVAILAALTISQLLKGPAEELLGIYLPSWGDVFGTPGIIIVLTLLLGVLVTTFYPFALIYNRSTNDFFGNSRKELRYSSFHSGLVVFQYTSAIILMIWIVTSNSQLNFILSKDIGLNPQRVVVVEGPAHIKEYSDPRVSSFLNEVRRIKGVAGTTVSYSLIGEPDVKGITVQRNHASNFVGTDCNGGVDANFLKTFDVPLLSGRNFLADNPADRNAVLISYELSRRLGFASPEEALGQRILLPEHDRRDVEIIGVFSDYQFRPWYNEFTEDGRGIVLMYKDYLIPSFKPLKLSVRLETTDNFNEIISTIEALHQSLFAGDTFKWYWLDEKVAKQYSNENVAKNQIALFTLLAVFISCLGLLGILSNKAVQKTKEIGIRKVLGARLTQIARLLLGTTCFQVLAAIAIGTPIAHYLTRQYLQKFSEQIDLTWWHYTIPVAALITIMLATVATVVWKAAKNNPVDALKHE